MRPVDRTQPARSNADQVEKIRPIRAQAPSALAHGHLTVGGMDDRIESTLPPVFSPKIVPRS